MENSVSFKTGRVRRVFFFLIAIGLGFAIALLSGSNDAHAWGVKGRDRAHRWVKDLNLTEQQKEQFKAIKEKYKGKLKESRAGLRSAQKDLVTSLQTPKRGDAYNAELMSKFKKTQELKQAQQQSRFEMALEIRSILTDEQIAKFKAMPKHRGHGRGKFFGDGGGGDDAGPGEE